MSRLYEAVVSWVRGRSRNERIGLAAVPLVLVVAVVGMLIAGGGDGAGRWLAGSSETAPADAPAGESGGGSNPDAADDRPGSTGPVETPPPYVNNFAEQPGVRPNAPLPSPTADVDVDEGIDGCDHAYGDRSVCVPWVFPDGVTDKCEWLREHDFKPLEITGGRDRHGLDRNGDGTACGSGD